MIKVKKILTYLIYFAANRAIKTNRFLDTLNPLNIREKHSRTYRAFGRNYINSPMVSINQAREWLSELSKIDIIKLIFTGYVIDSRTNETIATFFNVENCMVLSFLVDTNGGKLNKTSDKFNQYYIIYTNGFINIKNKNVLIKYNTPITKNSYNNLKYSIKCLLNTLK